MHYYHGPSTLSEGFPSSPPAGTSSPANSSLSPSRASQRKEKRNPSVTPRRFGRFFTPRSSLPGGGRRILGMLDDSSTNTRQQISPQSILTDPLDSDPICPSSPTERLGGLDSDASKRKWHESSQQALKRRRGLVSDDMPPPQFNLPGLSARSFRDENMQTADGNAAIRSSPDVLAEKRKATLNLFFKASRGGVRDQHEKSKPTMQDVFSTDPTSSTPLEGYEPRPIRKFRNRGVESHLMDREHGFSSHPGKQYLAFPACDARTETADFCSRSFDYHHCTAYTGQGNTNTIPFSLASCHRAPVTAIGDEEGFVRLFNTETVDEPVDSKIDVHIKIHDNAIMDLSFSEDDFRLATACGDRTGKIVDVPTQTVAVELASGHWDSLRQIAFQPGQSNGNALATSDRAGRIQMWDLRCSSAPTNSFSARDGPDSITERDVQLDPLPAKTINTIDNAHERTVHGNTSSASVTSIHWFSAGREHLLLSASEANASIKLWDTRYIKPRRQAEETPLAVTQQPLSHTWRSYGITSMAISSDAARLYAVCKDSTVYAYSTAHLMLGHAPELADGATKRRPGGAEGLGPMYGFKHQMFRAQSFYVKCAIRPSNDRSCSELLAVGSTDGCAVLFPTDERYLRSAWAQRSHILPDPASQSFSFPATPSQSASASTSSLLPISRIGTPLIRGHSREVTILSWSNEGKLITASDDAIVRHWQQDATQARHLRQIGEFGGERYMAGWADTGDDWDVCSDEE